MLLKLLNLKQKRFFLFAGSGFKFGYLSLEILVGKKIGSIFLLHLFVLELILLGLDLLVNYLVHFLFQVILLIKSQH